MNPKSQKKKPKECHICHNETEELDLYYSRLEKVYIWVCRRRNCCYEANLGFYYKLKKGGDDRERRTRKD